MVQRWILVVTLLGGGMASGTAAPAETLLAGSLEWVFSPSGPPSLLGFRTDFLEASLCGRSGKTVGAADCKIATVRDGGPPGLIKQIPGGEIHLERAYPVAASVSHFNGYSLTSLETSCGHWFFRWALAPTKSGASLDLWLEPGAAGTAGTFVGRLAALVRVSFTHASAGTALGVDRPLELDLEGTWNLLPPDAVPPGATNLQLAGLPERAIAGVGDCSMMWFVPPPISP
jgi:hypothetical protein